MYTSVIDDRTMTEKIRRKTLVYLAVSALFLLFGAVYEHFSHGVYSYYMIYCFAFPLVMGCFFWTVMTVLKRRPKFCKLFCDFHAAAIFTFTLGSVFKGVIEIFGTDSSLAPVYWFVGAALELAAIISLVYVNVKNKAKTNPEYQI